VDFVDEVVKIQYTEIRYTFGTSLSKIMNPHRQVRNSHGGEMFLDLYRKVSHKAINLLEKECKRIHTLRRNNETCGHQLYSSCGLPCACRLERIINAGIFTDLCVVYKFGFAYR
jgi:hypothetical protein